jgi:hypothetical protein
VSEHPKIDEIRHLVRLDKGNDLPVHVATSLAINQICDLLEGVTKDCLFCGSEIIDRCSKEHGH